MKRLLLLVLTNLAVLVVFSLVLNIVFAATGMEPGGQSGLLLFAAVIGFGGAFVSLFLSKWMALRAVGGQVIERPGNETERFLLSKVERLAQQAGIGMPQVAIYDSADMNAFATGYNRNNSLVAVSTGLLANMNEQEAEAVLAHEISHIANGDMITLTLIQGVVNTFVIFLARVVANAVNNALRDGGRQSDGLGWFTYMALVAILEITFGLLASIVVMAFSRQREYRADAGAAKLVGKQGMIAALQRLKMSQESNLDGTLMAFGIRGKRSWSELWLSHPPLQKRIAALMQE
ncbi:protease HtpX [Neptunicella marina]|uniref:Protease HtpX n=1 Tax=Neptunicella marina TaxID=2125989 RepID=A0A8J6LV36_9ALTE|nr:protease HtpX [Neptunicella marina]MBC3764304.1 protease HtpX [Neptunicella marina]